jgi:hypothetical protein
MTGLNSGAIRAKCVSVAGGVCNVARLGTCSAGPRQS